MCPNRYGSFPETQVFCYLDACLDEALPLDLHLHPLRSDAAPPNQGNHSPAVNEGSIQCII